MLKDHIDPRKIAQQLNDSLAGKGERPPVAATWRRATAGERCDGCKKPFRPNERVMVALADSSVGHHECQTGSPGPTVTFHGPPPRKRRSGLS